MPEGVVATYCGRHGIHGSMTLSEIYEFSRSSERYFRGKDEVDEIKKYLSDMKAKKRRLNDIRGGVWHSEGR